MAVLGGIYVWSDGNITIATIQEPFELELHDKDLEVRHLLEMANQRRKAVGSAVEELPAASAFPPLRMVEVGCNLSVSGQGISRERE